MRSFDRKLARRMQLTANDASRKGGAAGGASAFARRVTDCGGLWQFPPMACNPVSIVTVTHNGYLFVRLLVEKVRALTADRPYEIIVVDRGSTDGTREWLGQQPDVRVIRKRYWWRKGHAHGEAAEAGVQAAQYERIVLLDSDAHPLTGDWLTESADRLDDNHRLAGAVFRDAHAGNPHGWYIHPHFMAFFKSDLGGLIVLRKLRGHATDTGEEATLRVLDAGKGVIGHEIRFAQQFDVGHPRVPTIAGGVFHAWYVTRLLKDDRDVARETGGVVSRATYLEPLMAKLRSHHALSY